MNSLKLIEIVDQSDKDYALALVPADTLIKFADTLLTKFAYDCMNVTSMPDHIEFVAKQWGVEL